MSIFERRESEVRSYCRTFDRVFTTAKGSKLTDENGREYIDFFAGAGTLNYGHNHPNLKKALIEYIESDGVTHSLDMFTQAKAQFLTRFEEVILKPRDMDYKIMFPGPTGTNAVEAALKLARKVTGRTNIVSFTNGFHGMTLGSLSVTGNAGKRGGAGVPLGNASALPFDGYLGDAVDTIKIVEKYLQDTSSGLDKPAAFIVETVQGEGGINVADPNWLNSLAKLAKKHDVLLIVDDIQMGCGRTGPFFSFERAEIKPDIITLSKSLSGYGLPFAITLFKPELDQWKPGEHNGTFRGHNPAFITAAKALDFWESNNLTGHIYDQGEFIQDRMEHLRAELSDQVSFTVRGIGLVWGLEFDQPEMAGKLSRRAFEHGLILETSGSQDQVAKIMPPLNIDRETLASGLDLLETALKSLVAETKKVSTRA